MPQEALLQLLELLNPLLLPPLLLLLQMMDELLLLDQMRLQQTAYLAIARDSNSRPAAATCRTPRSPWDRHPKRLRSPGFKKGLPFLILYILIVIIIIIIIVIIILLLLLLLFLLLLLLLLLLLVLQVLLLLLIWEEETIPVGSRFAAEILNPRGLFLGGP